LEKSLRIILLTFFALIAFAFNSILCRLALGNENIDAVGFTTIRLVSGAITLSIISIIFNRNQTNLKRGNWLSAFFLFAYAICFSFAYLKLTTATGALILFGSVQLTMICVALIKGERPKVLEWLGLLLAFGGLFYLVFPGLSAPPLAYSILMMSAGIAWGFYSLRGKASENPLADTTGNFIRTVPMILIIVLLFLSNIQISTKGIIFAILSGAIASGIGYSIWYRVLKDHTATRAAILQLSVPAIASVGGVIFLAENLSFRIFLASSLILGGILIAIIGKQKIKMA
jgi:drug/metabolite transporter (DMT)-like permease